MKRRRFLRGFSLAASGIFVPNLIVRPLFGVTNPTIVTTAGDNAISLTNAAFSRAIGFTGWSTLRVGIRVTMNGTVSTTGSPGFYIRVQHGSKLFLAGQPWVNGILAVWSGFAINNSGSTAYYGAPLAAQPQTHFNTSGAAGSNYAQNYEMTASSNTSTPDMFMAEFAKGSPNWTVKVCAPLYPKNNPTAVSQSQFYAAIVASDPRPNADYGFSAGQAIAFSESNGTIDTVSINWNPTNAIDAQVTDIVAYKFA